MTENKKLRSLRLDKLRELYEKGDMSLVIPEAKNLFQKYSSGIAYNILALAHKQQGKYQEAIDIYLNAVEEQPILDYCFRTIILLIILYFLYIILKK